MSTTGLILIVDDNPTNLSVLGELLEAQGFSIMAALSGEAGLAIAERKRPDLVLMDVQMPGGWNGYETCQHLRQDPRLARVPVLFLSAQSGTESKVTGFAAGGMDYVSKPFQAEELLARIRTHLELYRLREHLEDEVALKTEALRQVLDQLEQSYTECLELLSLAGEYRDLETGAHTRRIGAYSAAIARILGWSEAECRHIEQAAPLHDIGKISIPDRILLKEGPLDAAEWTIMQTHAAAGARLLRSHSSSPVFEMAAEIAECHHERFDGTGYPRGLRGEEIPLAARITTLVDVYDALRSRRPYKDGMAHEAALRILREGDHRFHPRHLDPALLALLDEHHGLLARIFEEQPEGPE
ncbi:MAG: response regulator [Gammaproteobacteria bacterium]|nr:response regulator [Gammaproteobacteria bacterium]